MGECRRREFIVVCIETLARKTQTDRTAAILLCVGG